MKLEMLAHLLGGRRYARNPFATLSKPTSCFPSQTTSHHPTIQEIKQAHDSRMEASNR